ncbi:hypothetical protein [Streptomyces pratensis]|uniref:hypothetical protein n=1 Tax=Streptomyces pratensis TaxID=1169025 RepID=UPI003017AF1D
MNKRRLRSSTVVLGGMGLLALALSSCGSEPDRRCADRTTRETLPGHECRGGSGGSGGAGGTGGGSRGAYYYGGESSDGRVKGGSFDKSAVDRGGFGCTRSGGG